MHSPSGGFSLQRRTGCIIWLIICGAIFVLFLAWQYFDFRSANRTLPVGMTMAGLSVEGKTREQALGDLEGAFVTPLEVTYQEERLSLHPDSVELRYRAEETAVSLDAALEEQAGIEGFIAHVLRQPQAPIDVPVAVTYSEDRLDNFLARVAGQHDQLPQEPVLLTDNLAWRPGRPGYELDVEASRERLAAALVSATREPVALVVQVEEAPSPDLDLLEQLLLPILNDHPDLTPGIFVKDLRTGAELGINADVAYTGLSVLKIAILAESYHTLDLPLDPEITAWLSNTMGVNDSNATANLLLRDVIGKGDSYQGVENLTNSMNRLGLVNTFMATPYDRDEAEEEIVPLTIVTPANSRTDVSAEPDPYMQTTPLDMGLLLEMIYQCSRGGGTLMVAHTDAFTVDECKQMIEWMSANRIDSLIEAGVPVGTKVAHKHGFAGDTHADAALVFSPGGDFVLVVYLHRSQWLEWEESAPLISDIATATYNYLNPVQ
jgi:beta-lactamase class A